MSDKELIKMVRQHVHLEYEVHPGRQMSQYLSKFAEGKIFGRRSVEGKVYVPPLGVCPTTGEKLLEEVEVKDSGTVTTFCIVNIPFEGQQIKPPYVLAAILLDGSDLPIFHLLGNVVATDAHMGMRVQAKWRDESEFEPTMENILYFEPSGEPDAEYESYQEHI